MQTQRNSIAFLSDTKTQITPQIPAAGYAFCQNALAVKPETSYTGTQCTLCTNTTVMVLSGRYGTGTQDDNILARKTTWYWYAGDMVLARTRHGTGTQET